MLSSRVYKSLAQAWVTYEVPPNLDLIQSAKTGKAARAHDRTFLHSTTNEANKADS